MPVHKVPGGYKIKRAPSLGMRFSYTTAPGCCEIPRSFLILHLGNSFFIGYSFVVSPGSSDVSGIFRIFAPDVRHSAYRPGSREISRFFYYLCLVNHCFLHSYLLPRQLRNSRGFSIFVPLLSRFPPSARTFRHFAPGRGIFFDFAQKRLYFALITPDPITYTTQTYKCEIREFLGK